MKLNPLLKSFPFIILLSGLLVVNNFAQCNGTYFKRVSSTLIPIPARIYNSDDMNGDGVLDLTGAVVNPTTGTLTKLFVTPGTGQGRFGSPIVISPPSQLPINTFFTGNLDSDVFKDILVQYNTSPPTMQAFRNNGNGTFTPQQSVFTTDNIGYPVSLVDVNNDGKADYIGSFNNSGITDLRLSLGNGDGTFSNTVVIANDVHHSVWGDFNTDGRIDVVIGNNLLLNAGGGNFTVVQNAVPLGDLYSLQTARDFTGDGRPDILSYRSTNYSVAVNLFTNLGNNSFSRTDYNIPFINASDFNHGEVRIGNFSGDQSPDVLIIRNFENIVILANNGAGTFTRQNTDYNFFNFPLTGDFDGDGKDDVLSRSNSQWVSAGDSASKAFPDEATATIQKNVCARPGQPRLVDFNHDMVTDLNFWTPTSGTWSFSSYSGRQSVNWGSGSLGDIPTPGDFDGDGVTDQAVYRNSTGVWYVRRSSDLGWFVLNFGLPGDKPVAADYDGDSISDIAVFRPSDGNWYIWYMGTQTYSITHFGLEGDKPVPEDYDGDLKTDLAVFRPSTGVWYDLHSTDGGYDAIQWGISTDTPVPADYDGDGKADLAVYRGSQSTWYIRRSYDNTSTALQYGLAGDIPQPGDYNGDGVVEPAIYRPSIGVWYMYFSYAQFNFGGSNVIPASTILRSE